MFSQMLAFPYCWVSIFLYSPYIKTQFLLLLSHSVSPFLARFQIFLIFDFRFERDDFAPRFMRFLCGFGDALLLRLSINRFAFKLGGLRLKLFLLGVFVFEFGEFGERFQMTVVRGFKRFQFLGRRFRTVKIGLNTNFLALVRFELKLQFIAAFAKLFDLPTVLTTSEDTGFNGPILPEIRALHPDAPLIRRQGEINAWDNADFRKAVEATGRKQIIIGGIFTDVRVSPVPVDSSDADVLTSLMTANPGLHDVLLPLARRSRIHGLREQRRIGHVRRQDRK